MKVLHAVTFAACAFWHSPVVAQETSPAEVRPQVPMVVAPAQPLTAVAAPAAPVRPGTESVGSDATPGRWRPATGFAVELRLETSLFALSDEFIFPASGGGLFVGYRGRTVTVGVGADLMRTAEWHDSPTFDTERAVTIVYLMPGARAVLAQSRDGTTELLAQLDLGYGATYVSRRDSPSPTPPPEREEPTRRRWRAQLGPALRHWLAPGFAIGASAGLRYDRQTFSEELDDGERSSGFATSSLYGALQMTGVF